MPDRMHRDLSHLSVATKSKLSLYPRCQLLRAGRVIQAATVNIKNTVTLFVKVTGLTICKLTVSI